MSNLKFRHDVNSYAEAKALWKQGVRDLCYNTRLRRAPSRLHGQPDEADAYQIVHFETPILTFYADGSVMIDATWVSRTTAHRLHHYKPSFIEGVGSRIVKNGKYEGRYAVRLRNHPGEFDIWEGESYVVHPDATVVKA